LEGIWVWQPFDLLREAATTYAFGLSLTGMSCKESSIDVDYVAVIREGKNWGEEQGEWSCAFFLNDAVAELAAIFGRCAIVPVG
jgi:hypothetical protein